MVSSGDSASTQPYSENGWEQKQQLMDSGSTGYYKSNGIANTSSLVPQQAYGVSPPDPVQTPPSFRPPRANYEPQRRTPTGAAAAAAGQWEQNNHSPHPMSIQDHRQTHYRPEGPPGGNYGPQTQASNEAAGQSWGHNNSHAAHPMALDFRPMQSRENYGPQTQAPNEAAGQSWDQNNNHAAHPMALQDSRQMQSRSEGPMSAGREKIGRTENAPRTVFVGGNPFPHSEQLAMGSPSQPPRNGYNGWTRGAGGAGLGNSSQASHPLSNSTPPPPGFPREIASGTGFGTISPSQPARNGYNGWTRGAGGADLSNSSQASHPLSNSTPPPPGFPREIPSGTSSGTISPSQPARNDSNEWLHTRAGVENIPSTSQQTGLHMFTSTPPSQAFSRDDQEMQWPQDYSKSAGREEIGRTDDVSLAVWGMDSASQLARNGSNGRLHTRAAVASIPSSSHQAGHHMDTSTPPSPGFPGDHQQMQCNPGGRPSATRRENGGWMDDAARTALDRWNLVPVPQQPAIGSPSQTARDGASTGFTSPVLQDLRDRSGKSLCSGTEQARTPLTQRELFHKKIRSEGASNRSPHSSNQQSNHIVVVPERNDEQPLSDSKAEARRKALVAEEVQSVYGTPQRIMWASATHHLKALCSLDFIKYFQVLQWLNGRPLEELFTLQDIERLSNVPPVDVQPWLSRRYAEQNGLQHDIRDLSVEKKAEIENPRYECCVHGTGELTFKVSEQKDRLTALQRCFGRDRVLRVFFEEEEQATKKMNGFLVGRRLYQYWTHKDTKKDYGTRKKPVGEKFWSSIHCYFVCTSSLAISDLENRDFKTFGSIAEARGYMMHIHTAPNIAKYIARLQLALSQTVPVDLDISTINVVVEDDIYCTDDVGVTTNSTDGAGRISVDLAKKIGDSLKKDKTDPDKIFGPQEYPLLIQIRLFHNGSAYKGTLLADSSMAEEQANTIVMRKSMQKVKADPKLSHTDSFNSLEICGCSKPHREAKLSQDLIVLLTLGGVPEKFFLERLEETIRDAESVFKKRETAYHAIGDQTAKIAKLAKRMLLAGIPPKEPFLRKTLMDLRQDVLQDFCKGRVHLPQSCHLYGTADPTGTLKPNQVAIALDYGLVSWPKVGVFKSPGKHPGDFHIFEAIHSKELQKVVGDGKYVIIFPVRGPRSIPHEIANSDLDGDKYFITWNTKLLANYKENLDRWHEEAEESSEPAPPRPMDLPRHKWEENLIEKFLNARFNPSPEVGKVANWWVAHMDQSILFKWLNSDQSRWHLKEALELVDVFYKLLDSEKTGKKVLYRQSLKPEKSPHFQERGKTNGQASGFGHYVNADEYKSTTILGKIYNRAKEAEQRWRRKSSEYIELDPAFNISEIKGDRPSTDELYQKWKIHFKTYTDEMSAAMKVDPTLKGDKCDAIILKYRNLLYGADSLYKTSTGHDKMFASAAAIYLVVYGEAQTWGSPRTSQNSNAARMRQWNSSEDDPLRLKLYFAWAVAGTALCQMYEKYYRPDNIEQMTILPMAFDNIFGRSPSSDTTDDDEEDLDHL